MGVILQCDISAGMIRRSKGAADPEVPVLSIIADESMAPFREKSADLVVSSLSAHWVNDLPKWFVFICFINFKIRCQTPSLLTSYN